MNKSKFNAALNDDGTDGVKSRHTRSWVSGLIADCLMFRIRFTHHLSCFIRTDLSNKNFRAWNIYHLTSRKALRSSSSSRNSNINAVIWSAGGRGWTQKKLQINMLLHFWWRHQPSSPDWHPIFNTRIIFAEQKAFGVRSGPKAKSLPYTYMQYT